MCCATILAIPDVTLNPRHLAGALQVSQGLNLESWLLPHHSVYGDHVPAALGLGHVKPFKEQGWWRSGQHEFGFRTQKVHLCLYTDACFHWDSHAPYQSLLMGNYCVNMEWLCQIFQTEPICDKYEWVVGARQVGSSGKDRFHSDHPMIVVCISQGWQEFSWRAQAEVL